MEITSIALSAVVARQAQTSQALATEMAKQAHEQDQLMVGLLEQAAESAKAANAQVPGSAGLVDITV